jgi:uncharacterized protein (DUF983 family)
MQAMRRGWKRQCPACGEGHLYSGEGFKRFIKIVERCTVCNERLGHIRADDIPAYFTVAIVGHIVLSGMLVVADKQYPEWAQLAVLLPLTAFLIYWFLPRVKGAVAARLWALGMPTGVRDNEAQLTPE